MSRRERGVAVEISRDPVMTSAIDLSKRSAPGTPSLSTEGAEGVRD